MASASHDVILNLCDEISTHQILKPTDDLKSKELSLSQNESKNIKKYNLVTPIKEEYVVTSCAADFVPKKFRQRSLSFNENNEIGSHSDLHMNSSEQTEYFSENERYFGYDEEYNFSGEEDCELNANCSEESCYLETELSSDNGNTHSNSLFSFSSKTVVPDDVILCNGDNKALEVGRSRPLSIHNECSFYNLGNVSQYLEDRYKSYKPSEVIMIFRHEIEELSMKCISKILEKQKKSSFLHKARHSKALNRMLHNLSLQQKQFENEVSSIKSELVSLLISFSGNVVEKCEQIKGKFLDECRLFEYFFPAYAFKSDIMTALEDKQVIIVKDDNLYRFDLIIPLFLQMKFQSNLIISCSTCELAKLELSRWFSNFFNSKVMNEESDKSRIICLKQEDMLNFLSNVPCSLKETYVIVKLPFFRSVTTDILLANFREILKLNGDLKLILLLASSVDMPLYHCYFSGITTVSVLKTKKLGYPVTTVWKDNSLTPEDDYIGMVVKTILSILALKEFGEILVFLPELCDIKLALSILTEQLLKFNYKDAECIVLHENNSSVLKSCIFTTGDCKRRIYLTSDCAESIIIPSVQYVVDCGLKKLYFYDGNTKADALRTTFLSSQNAAFRKQLAGVFKPGVCYRIYSKRNFVKDMPFRDIPESLRVSPYNTMIKIMRYRSNNALKTEFMEFFSQKIVSDTLQTLKRCGAVKNNVLTALGGKIGNLPLPVQYSKTILLGLQQGIILETIVLVAFLSNKSSIFQHSGDEKRQRIIDAVKLELTQNESDTLTYIYIYKMYTENNFSDVWCANHYIRSDVVRNIHLDVIQMCHMVNTCLGEFVPKVFLEKEDCLLKLREIIFDCFKENLCVYTGHFKSGYRVLSSSSVAFVHPTSVLFQKKNLPQFVLFDHLLPKNNDFLVQLTAIPDDLIMKSLREGSLEFDHSDLFDTSLVKRVIEPIGEELMNELMLEGRLRSIEKQIKRESGSDFIFLDLSVTKGRANIYALPDCIDYAQCTIEDILKKKHDNLLNELQIEILELKSRHNIVNIEIKWSKGALATSVDVCSNSQRHSTVPDETTEGDIVVCNQPSAFYPYQLCMSLVRRSCAGQGFVTFNSEEDFMHARKLALRMIKLLGAEIFIQVNSKKINQLHLTGLPPETRAGNLKRELLLLLPNSKISNIELTYKPPLETSENDVSMLTAKVIAQCEELNISGEFEAVIPRPDAKDIDLKVFVRTQNNIVLDFLAGTLPMVVVNDRKFIHELSYTLFIKCNAEVCNALKVRFVSELSQIKKDLKVYYENEDEYKFDFQIEGLPEDKAMIKVTSKNNEVLTLLHVTITNLLEGEVVSGENVNRLEDLFFHGGRVWLRNLGRSESVYIVEDYKQKTLRLYGSSDSCENIRREIVKFLENADEEVMHTIFLYSEHNSSLLKSIIKEYGVNMEKFVQECELRSAFLDIQARQLLLRGSQQSIEKAENCIKSLSNGLDFIIPPLEESQETCPVCVCPAVNLTFRLEHCGHLYCLDCLKALVEQGQFPIRCCAEKCSKDIVLKDIRKVMRDDSNKIKDLLEKSMKDYLERNRTSILFCPAPDCSMFFYKLEQPKHKLSCPLCEKDICLSCNALYHTGFSCDMYQNSKRDPDYSFKVWQKTTTQCKQCPRCKTAIEKVSGCNRMHCRSCKGSFCWICVKEFASDTQVYNHIHAAHTGMLFA